MLQQIVYGSPFPSIGFERYNKQGTADKNAHERKIEVLEADLAQRDAKRKTWKRLAIFAIMSMAVWLNSEKLGELVVRA